MSDLPKRIRKQATELVEIAYARELSSHLEELAQKFDLWRKNEIDCWDISNLIHKFHDGISRDLFKTYNTTNNLIFLISRSISTGYLNTNEVPDEILELTQNFAVF